MSSLSQRGIAGQRGDERGWVALHQARAMLLHGPQARADGLIEDLAPPFEVLPEALHRRQRGALSRPPHPDDGLRDRDALCARRRGVIHEEQSETLGLVLAHLLQQDSAAVRLEARALCEQGGGRRDVVVAGRGRRRVRLAWRC